MNYTKGPWKIKPSQDKHETPSIVADGPDTPGIIKICRLNDPYLPGYSQYGEIDANTHLMAAAPAMYEALRKIISFNDNHTYSAGNEAFRNDTMAVVYEALAKAEGK
jgi:hypothetical protein